MVGTINPGLRGSNEPSRASSRSGAELLLERCESSATMKASSGGDVDSIGSTLLGWISSRFARIGRPS